MLKDLIYKKGPAFYPYILHLPEGYKKGKKYPLVMFLHGKGQCGHNFEHYQIALPKMLKQGYTKDAIIVCPQCEVDMTWTMQALSLKQFLLDMCKKYNADPDRVYVTGLSLGGYGTWEMITDFPELFAAAGPVCGGGVFWRAERANMPVKAYHGTEDQLVPYEKSVEMVNAVNAAGGHAELVTLEGYNHNTWDYAYEQDGLIDWLLQHKNRNT